MIEIINHTSYLELAIFAILFGFFFSFGQDLYSMLKTAIRRLISSGSAAK